MNKNLKAIGTGLGVLVLLNLLIFIPFTGWFLVFTLAPLLSGYFSGRQVKNWRNALCVGVIWSAIQIIIFMTVLSSVFTFLSISLGVSEFFIIILIFVFNTGFCVLGNRSA